MTVPPEGLRIEFSEAASGTFFDNGSARLNEDGGTLLATSAQELGSLSNKLSLEKQTGSRPYAPSATYRNWKLSSDRANAARRGMQASGIRADQLRHPKSYGWRPELVNPQPDIQLLSEHQIVEYGPVPFPRKNTTLWLPKSAEIYFDFRKHRYYRRHSFDHYMLYSIDSEEKRKEPKVKKES